MKYLLSNFTYIPQGINANICPYCEHIRPNSLETKSNHIDSSVVFVKPVVYTTSLSLYLFPRIWID